MVKRILVGLGGTEYTARAVDTAITLAIAHQAELTGVSVLDEDRLASVGPVPIGGGAFARDLVESRLEKARDLIEWSVAMFSEKCCAAGVSHQVVRKVAEPFSVLIDLARYHDLIVSGLRNLFEFNLVDDPHDVLVRLVRSGVRPLLAVSETIRPIERVLIAYSGSMESAIAMKCFAQLRLWPASRLRVVAFGGKSAGPAEIAEAEAYCRAHGYETEADCVPGGAKEELLPYAEQWKADLVVLGNSGRSLFISQALGATSLHVIRNANLPLFLSQ